VDSICLDVIIFLPKFPTRMKTLYTQTCH